MQEIEHFISRVAAAGPMPGGGSVAALAGALAAALGEMMAGLTEGREKFASAQHKVLDMHSALSAFRNEFLDLIQEDSVAYQSLLNALRMLRDTEEQKILRAEAIEKSARSATETPLRTARAAFRVLECLKTLIEVGNPHARSDAAVGAQLAFAALKAGQYNVLANIRLQKDRSFTDKCSAEISDLVFKGREILRHIERQMTGE
jgi:methenyltetrahydrofolate cyclohydrolase